MLKPIIGGYGTPKFCGETFTGGSKTAKFVNDFPWSSVQYLPDITLPVPRDDVETQSGFYLAQDI